MNATPETNPCEAFEIALSALVDGELETPEQLPTIDHLLACSACRDFYRRARALDGLTASVQGRPAEKLAPPPDAVWRRIAAESGLEGRGRLLAFPRLGAWAAPLAALLVLALGLGFLGVWLPSAGPPPRPDGMAAEGVVADGDEPGGTGEAAVELEGARGEMTDDRFVELAVELLRADRRYHRKMLQVMNVVMAMTPEEGPVDERSVSPDNPRITLGEDRRRSEDTLVIGSDRL